MMRRVATTVGLAWVVFRKELVDALRDQRTLLVVLLSAVAVGPLALVALSLLVADLEADAASRQVHAVGLAQAPTLRNYLLRQNLGLHEAPGDPAQALASGALTQPVLVVPPDFERQLQAGLAPRLQVLTRSGQRRVQGAAQALLQQLQGFNQEQATLRLALRGVPPAVLQVVQVDEQDLDANAQRGAQFTRMLPFFVLMAVLYGALNAALDSTAGERERGSLEPLLGTPAPHAALVLGKWGAVAAIGMLVALLSCAGFLPGQWLMRSATLAAMFRFGPAEAMAFLALLLPLAALLAALLMAVALRSRSTKEAQANTTVVVLGCALLPMVTLFGSGAERAWQLWVPALAQATLMQRVLGGDAVGALDLLLPLGVAALLTAACLAWVTRQLRAGVWG